MLNFLKKTNSKKLTEVQIEQQATSENENFESSYNSEKEQLENRFNLLSQSYNELFSVEKENRAKKSVISNKDQSKTKKRIYILSKVKVSTQYKVPFSIENIDDYFAEAIHGITAKNLIDQEIQNELTDIRLQMATAEKNLSIDHRKFDQPIKAVKHLDSPNYLPPIPTKKSQEILEDVFSELDSLIAGDKAYISNGKASIIRNKKKSKKSNQLKKAINNIRL